MWRSWESQTPLTRSIAHTVPILVQHDIRCKNSFVEVCHILKTILFEKFHTTAGRKGKSSLCIVDPAWTRPVHSRESERDYWARGYLLISSKKLKLTAINFVFKLFSFQMVQYIFIQLRVSFMCGKLGLFVWWATCSRVPQLKCILKDFQEQVGWGTRLSIWHNNSAEPCYLYQYSTADDWNWTLKIHAI